MERPRNGKVRIGTYYNVQEFLDRVEIHHTKKDLTIWDGIEIKLGSDRYKTFKTKGLKCRCGLTGVFLAAERTFTKLPPKIISYHMNLYALRPDGTEVLMTKDHIIPRSKGGKDVLENYEPMCERCNTKKADKIEIQPQTIDINYENQTPQNLNQSSTGSRQRGNQERDNSPAFRIEQSPQSDEGRRETFPVNSLSRC